MSKTLTEYCGLCWHEWCGDTNTISSYCNKCHVYFAPKEATDFTTGNYWEILAAKIGEKGDWVKFYEWLPMTEFIAISGCMFHQKPAAEKSKLFAEYLGEGIRKGEC